MAPYRTLDAWRGIASLAVVAFHWGELAVRRVPELATTPLYAASHYGSLGVQAFFVISGFCIANAGMATLRRGEPLGSYAWARIRRIYPTYWAALCFAIAFYLSGYLMARHGMIVDNVFTQRNPLAGPPLYYFANLTLTMHVLRQPITLAVAWTLCYEVAFYAIVGITLFLCRRLRCESFVLPLLHSLTTVCLAGLILFPKHNLFPLDLWPHFGLGVFVYDILSRPTVRAIRWWLAAVLALYSTHIMLYNLPVGFMGQWSRPTFLVAAVFAVFLVAAYRHDERWSRLPVVRTLGIVGLFSYSLYLTHTITIRIVNKSIDVLHLPMWGHDLYFALAALAAVGFAYVFYLLFERPLLRAGKRPVARAKALPEAAAGEPAA